ncbi:MCE family protein [Mycolicibacterium holsaticum]|uniref:MCE family protein n=1 Tax=Mycolicibacterium holsaticum TaxID=152142 RepID=UPI001C7CF4BA|nr:MCE family protein [Mycolicibacterium holsaticum]QZA11760.1 MCE family protein [Mycolicibacterium holsaticum DSM 44478 = JCM 12374]UNC10753.1 MCE family protein [Mycolicibacterium holsaticum DSM 44478 = JCM 12374]
MTSPTRINTPRTPRHRVAGLVWLLAGALVISLVYLQFRGEFTAKIKLTMIASRAGLSMGAGGKVTFNGVQIGRVASVSETNYAGEPAAKFILDVSPKYIEMLPANVGADIVATTAFGNKYVSFIPPDNPDEKRITSGDVIDARSVTTEFNTLFATMTSIAKKVDPVKLNLTLSAAAQALSGLGDDVGEAIVNANAVLDEINPKMPQIRYNIQQLASLSDIYANASPELWDSLEHAVTTARTLNDQQDDLDAALLAAIGMGNTAADVMERGGPNLVRSVTDLVPTAQLLDKYSPSLFCTIRNFAGVSQAAETVVGGNGSSVQVVVEFLGSENPWVYPDNLPRVNARGGPGGRPGCWQPITRDLWPAPTLVTDTGASIAPYNHFEIGQPLLTEYVWGRQFGENTINP